MNIWKFWSLPIRIKLFWFIRIESRKSSRLMHPYLSTRRELEKKIFCDAVIEICVCEERECDLGRA